MSSQAFRDLWSQCMSALSGRCSKLWVIDSLIVSFPISFLVTRNFSPRDISWYRSRGP